MNCFRGLATSSLHFLHRLGCPTAVYLIPDHRSTAWRHILSRAFSISRGIFRGYNVSLNFALRGIVRVPSGHDTLVKSALPTDTVVAANTKNYNVRVSL